MSTKPSKSLYAEVRAGFVRQGTSLNKWCIAHKFQRQSARKALLGEWRGPGAARFLEQVVAASKAHE